MDAITSTEFRKRYAKITEQVAVTVNGHIIGMWVPGAAMSYEMAGHVEPGGGAAVIDRITLKPHSEVQKQRDDLLRKINRSR